MTLRSSKFFLPFQSGRFLQSNLLLLHPIKSFTPPSNQIFHSSIQSNLSLLHPIKSFPPPSNQILHSSIQSNPSLLHPIKSFPPPSNQILHSSIQSNPSLLHPIKYFPPPSNQIFKFKPPFPANLQSNHSITTLRSHSIQLSCTASSSPRCYQGDFPRMHSSRAV